MPDTLETVGQDAEAVAAVRGGDAERYRELVERHERRVFAVAWSRLGDAALAEEATQEAFIRGYRRLWLLGDGAKFAGWITTLARNAAINLGLKHRRELNKRERWALEQTDAPAAEADAPEICTPETLRQTLAELPDAHRECLVLFYLEGKSGAETAAALEISESAFRVRLHRARAALREQLEEKLASSLEKLRPTKLLVPAIMAGVLASSSAKAATAGGTVAFGASAKILPALGKSAVFAWLVPLISLLAHLPGMALAWFVSRKEQKNFRDADGFRPRLYRQFFRSFLWGFPVLVILIFGLQHSAGAAWGLKGSLFATACFCTALLFISARALFITCNVFQVSQCAYVMIITSGMWALALGWLPPQLGSLPMALATLLFACTLQYRPARMDFNLFLRATQGMLRFSEDDANEAPAKRFDEREVLRFARFLGARYLVINFHRDDRGLQLLLPPVKTRFLVNMAKTFVPLGRSCSSVSLEADGTVFARCHESDVADLHAIKPGDLIAPGELEAHVAAAIAAAWRAFRSGNTAAAERALGQVPEGEVFNVPVKRSPWTRWGRWLMVGCTAVMIGCMIVSWKLSKNSSANGRFYKPVSVSETEIRASLAQLAYPTNTQSPLIRDAAFVADRFEVLPSTNLFTPEAWWKMKQRIVEGFEKSDLRKQTSSEQRLTQLLGSPKITGALINGWLAIEDIGWTREGFRQALQHASKQAKKFYLQLNETGVQNETYKILNTKYFTDRLRCVRLLGCLDLLDGSSAVETLLRHQVLSDQLPAGRRPNLDPKLLHGTFLTSGWDPIQETWRALVLLEAFGALNRVDREACVNGILRFHHGNGLFGSVRQGDGFVIFGDAEDTYYAFESLRMLKALDRIKDIEQWKFCPRSASKPAAASSLRTVTWEEVEAFVMQQRFERFLHERKENPQAPARSLSEL